MVNACEKPQFQSYEDFQAYLYRCIPANATNRDLFDAVLEEMKTQSQFRLSNSVLAILVAVYVIFMVFGALGSSLVIYAVVHRRSMRSPRNIFIVNLAISDFILCVLTQPFNLIRLFSGQQEWILGDVMCKLSSLLQGTNIFVSTISITAIALDRFQVIIHPTITSLDRKAAVNMLAVIWILSISLASPLMVFSKVRGDGQRQCTEKSQNFSMLFAKLIYSMLSALVQYIVPLIIVIIVNTKICIKIRSRMILSGQSGGSVERHVSQTGQNQNDDAECQLLSFKRSKRLLEEKRKCRTNILLASIALILALSWLPLISFNILMDIREMRFFLTSSILSVEKYDYANSSFSSVPDIDGSQLSGLNSKNEIFGTLKGQTVFLIQAGCLLAVLSSACINPILYGWLNENFRKEFKMIFRLKDSSHIDTRISMISKDINTYAKVNERQS